MKVSRAKEYLHLVQAMAEGKTIQSGSDEGCWTDWDKNEEINFDCDPKTYRIKPISKLRAWKPDEVPIGSVARFKGQSQKRVLITGCDEKHVYGTYTYALNYATFASLLENYEHSTDGGKTWLPCGVMEVQS